MRHRHLDRESDFFLWAVTAGGVSNRDNGSHRPRLIVCQGYTGQPQVAQHKGANDVINAALEALAEDLDDVAVTKAREHEPGISLEEVGSEVTGHTVTLSDSARKELRSLPHVTGRVQPKLSEITANPRPPGCKEAARL